MSGWQPIDTMPAKADVWLRSPDEGPCVGWQIFTPPYGSSPVCMRVPPILGAQRIYATEWMPITPGEYPWGAFPE
jgi:hypothetical protein